MCLEIIGAESMGARSLCCRVSLPNRQIIIDPGVSLGYLRHGLLPHPLQVAAGHRIRTKILQALTDATDVVFSHFHGDHVPLVKANPYQLPVRDLPSCFWGLHCWSKSDDGLSDDMSRRFRDLAGLLGANMQVAEGLSAGALSFSKAVPHGVPGSPMGTVMMTRIEMEKHVFVHASDIQLLDDATIDQVIKWQPDIVLAAGPPLYLGRLSKTDRNRAWHNALCLTQYIDVVILDHHLMRSMEGAVWLDELSLKAGKKVYCAADFMSQPRQLLEAKRDQLYEHMLVPYTWHDDYENCRVDLNEYLNALAELT